MLLLIFIISTLVSFKLCPAIFRVLTELKIYDVPKQRSVHRCKILRMGGFIFIAGYIASICLLPLMRGIVSSEHWFSLIGIILGGFLMALLGALDDYFDLRARTKFFYQWLIAAVVCSFGIQVDEFSMFGFGIQLGFFSIPFTMFWIVGVTNAVNLLDGLDGLAAGTAMIACIFLVFLGGSSHPVATLLIGLMGGLTAFLRYNSHPAKVFMGDVGSLFLGYHMAVGSVTLLPWQHSYAGFALPILILALPICDTLWAIGRRVREGKPPFSPDKNHIHHRLIGLGMGHRQAAACLYAISVCAGTMASILTGASGTTVTSILLLVAIMFFMFSLPLTRQQRVNQIHYLKSYKAARASHFGLDFADAKTR